MKKSYFLECFFKIYKDFYCNKSIKILIVAILFTFVRITFIITLFGYNSFINILFIFIINFLCFIVTIPFFSVLYLIGLFELIKLFKQSRRNING